VRRESAQLLVLERVPPQGRAEHLEKVLRQIVARDAATERDGRLRHRARVVVAARRNQQLVQLVQLEIDEPIELRVGHVRRRTRRVNTLVGVQARIGPKLCQGYRARHQLSSVFVVALVVARTPGAQVVHALKRIHDRARVSTLHSAGEVLSGLALCLAVQVLLTLGLFAEDCQQPLGHYAPPQVICTELPGSSCVKFPYAPKRSWYASASCRAHSEFFVSGLIKSSGQPPAVRRKISFGLFIHVRPLGTFGSETTSMMPFGPWICTVLKLIPYSLSLTSTSFCVPTSLRSPPKSSGFIHAWVTRIPASCASCAIGRASCRESV